MARKTQAQTIEQGNERCALAFLESALQALPDPRRPQGVRYPLRTVVVSALMAMVCGCDDAESMQMWAEANAEWLATMLELPHGPPTQDVFLAVFAAIDPQAFSAVFAAWAELLTAQLATGERHIAVDGKTSRRSFDTSHERLAIHTVSAWLSDAGLVLAQRKTGEKSNEITAIPKLLATLDLRAATITIDAMGCHTEIARTIVERGGHYLLCAKDNQPTLRQDIEATFAEAADPRRRSHDELERPMLEVFEQVDKGHGRVEKRTLRLCRDLAWLTTTERWPSLAFVAEVTRERTVLAKSETSTQTAYYIGSHPTASAQRVAETIRRHWGIETELHWVLDMAFGEDAARHRARNTAQNFTTLRHFALNLVKRDSTRKVGIANARKRAGWDRSYLLALLTGAGASS